MFEKNYTVTIGIPVHNEEQNIQLLLETLLTQTSAFYTLENIIIICDGCTDATETIAYNFAKHHPYVTVINDHLHLGKSERLNQLYQLNMSDIIITIDGDIVLGNSYSIDEMVRHFDDESISVVAANGHPMPGENLCEQMINTWYEFWYEVLSEYKKGATIHNMQGALIALRKEFAQHMKYPRWTIAHAQYVYFCAISQKTSCYFAKEAIYYFYSPNTIRDYLLFLNRRARERVRYAELFGNWIYKEYIIPKRYKVKGFLKTMRIHPGFLPFAFFFHLFRKNVLSHKTSVIREGIWQRITSTKRVIRKRATVGLPLHF